MTTDFNPFKDMPWMVDNVPVPTVAPEDLKMVWEMHQKTAEARPGQQVAIDASSYMMSCSPTADAMAAWYRLSVLGILSSLCMQSGMPVEKLPWMQSGKPDEFIFKALATLPMNGTPPSSVEELTRLIQKEYGARPGSNS
jgi:hypothetical protein